MHISSITLTNVRQFDNRTFEFKPGFNLLVGENGAGKTSILRGILTTIGSAQKIRTQFELDDDDIRLQEQNMKVCAEVQYLNNHNEVYLFEKKLWERAKRTPRGADRPIVLTYAANEATCSSLQAKRSSRFRGDKNDKIRQDEEFLFYAGRREIAKEDRTGISEDRFVNSRLVNDFVGSILSEFDLDFNAFIWNFEPYDCTLSLHEKYEIGVPLDAKILKQARAVAMRFFQEDKFLKFKMGFVWPDRSTVTLGDKSWWNPMAKELEMELHHVWDKMDISEESKFALRQSKVKVNLSPRIMIKRPMGLLGLSQLSDGEQRLFSMIVDIARELSLQEEHGWDLKRGKAVVLIDEIDVHLHPKWQRKIIPALEDFFPECQFIAATHSPFIIQAVNRQKIISIDPEKSISGFESGNSIEDIAEEIQGVDVPQRSKRAEALSEAAQKYFELLEMKRVGFYDVDDLEFKVAEKNYREASEAFTSNPAVHALLKVQLKEGKCL